MNAPRWTWIGLAVLAVGGAIAGAVWDWYNWHPMSAVVMTLVAGALLLIGGVMVAIRLGGARRLGRFVLALGLGIVVGQVLGPDRPALAASTGTVSIATERPTVATGSASASCAVDGAGQFQVSGDPNLRLDLGAADPNVPADVDQRAFVLVSVQVGDRWQGPADRPDAVQLTILVSGVADVAETVLEAADASRIDLQGTAASGTLRFSGLVPRLASDAASELADLAGVIEWTC